MKKIGNFFKNVFNFKKEGKINTKKVICSIGIVAVIIAAVLCFALGNKNNQEAVLNSKLKELGVNFYEEFYYEKIGSTQEEKEEILKRFTDKGIKINLDNLIRLNNDGEEDLENLFVNKKTGSACDAANTKVIIYPKENYGKKDDEIETVLECGFESKKTKESEK